VNLGFDPVLAGREALRCIECVQPACVHGCPVGVKVREFVDLVVLGDYLGAAAKIREDNVLPAVTGRVCPQEEQCEGSCVLGKHGAPLAIGHLERFVADYERSSGQLGLPTNAPSTGKRVAIVGSGPAGLAAAGDLVQRYDAIFLATGAGLPRFLGIPGEDLPGVYSANELLTRGNLLKAYRFPEVDEPVYDCRGKNVAVVGGGNTALDSIRTALRLGAASARLLYRRSEAEMPARAEEVRHAKAEGIEMRTLVNPVELLADDQGRLRAARLVRMALGEPDASGRRGTTPIEGSEFEIPLDVIIIAVGTGANPIVQSSTPGLATDRRGYIAADPETLRTSRRGVFAGGDIVTGAATVILAMGAGRTAARSIDGFLRTGEWEPGTSGPESQASKEK
jgi:glutamate synthase (NADPH/NADH) small chain